MVNKEYQQFNIEFRRPQVLRYAMPGAKPHALRDDERWVRTELAGPTNENMTGEFSLSMPYNNESPGPGWNVIGSIQKSSVYPLGNTPGRSARKNRGTDARGQAHQKNGQ